MTDLTSFDACKKRWWAWHEENPEFYRLFCRFTEELLANGHTNGSHWLIMNRIRWETYLKTRGDAYKIRNDFIAFYARQWMHQHPEHAGFFRIKRMVGEPEDAFLRLAGKSR